MSYIIGFPRVGKELAPAVDRQTAIGGKGELGRDQSPND